MNDAGFLKFIRTQPSCLPRLPGDDSPIEAAHVRRAHNSGVGMKPLFSAIPLSQNQHRHQHQHGETSLVNLCLGADMNRTEAHEYIDQKAEFYRMAYLDGAL